MYRNKKDVDKHVENLLSKLSEKEFKSRAYSIARLYFEVSDYANCQKYAEQYLTYKDNNAAAYKLLGQALQKMGLKEKALEQFKVSLDIDSTQTSTILEICELLADGEVNIDPGQAKYWCEKAEAIFPRHPVTFRLRERLIAMSNPDPEALVTLLNSELAIRPKDALLHARLLKHYLNVNKIKEAFEHACNVEFGTKSTFVNNYGWYEVLNDLLKHNSLNSNEWQYQLLLLTVKERICLLSITEIPSGTSKSLVESSDLLHAYDQAIHTVAKIGASPGFAEFHNGLLQHHRGQVAFHTATFLLKKAKKDQLNWRDALKVAGPLMLVAWQTVPLDSKVNWLKNAPEKQIVAVKRWYSEGTFRCSQAGHYLLSNIQDKNQSFLDHVSQCCSGTHWRDKLYKKIFLSKGHLEKIKSSYLASNAFNSPVLRLPRMIEVESYDDDAQKEYSNSLHYFVWTLLKYKNFAHFKCTLFDMLTYNSTTCGLETLNKSDIYAFLYCATLTAKQQLSQSSYVISDKPSTLPANITDLLCTLPQMKWWDCAYKFSQNELGTELTDIRATLSRGIEVVRCIDNHGLDPELLCILGRIFSERAKMSTNVDEKSQLEVRAGLYYSSAIPLLEKLKSKIVLKFLDKRMFDYTHKELGTKEINALLEECKLHVAINHLSEGEYDKVIEILSNLKSPQALYHLSQTYKKIAQEENNLSRDSEGKSKSVALWSKARMFAYKALDRLRDNETNKNHPLYTQIQELIEDIDTQLDSSAAVYNDGDGKYSSDENLSGGGIDHLAVRTNSHMFRNISSTPKAAGNANATNYRTAIDSQILESTRADQRFLERIENEIRNLQKRDTVISDFMEQTRNWFDENRKLGNQIISTIHSNTQNTTDQFRLLKISVDQVKEQMDECRNECKDVGELKKQVAELKKEVNKLKKASSEQTIDESDLYNLEEDYRTNDSTSSFATQLPFPSHVLPSFNQRLVPPFPAPPNPYQLYNQSLYSLYNQYSQFAQPSSVPGAQPMFDPTRTQVNYQGVYPTPDQMYLDVAHLVPPNVPVAPAVPPVPVVPTLSTVPTIPAVPTVTVPPPPVTSTTVSKTASSAEPKNGSRSLPVNVVITSSDPLPTCTTAPAPVLSVTIPPKHIKGTPHNYQIPMPTSNDTKLVSPPAFVFPAQSNKTAVTSSNLLSNWNQTSVFKATPESSTTTFNSLINSSLTTPKIGDTLESSKSVVDGPFTGSSPNTSLNKSRTLSERSNTSIENYDPCPDFKPIVPLPAEVKVTTGEEDETVIFSSRAKLFRYVDKQWKERGLGEMKLLKHKTTGKVRVLMRREQVHKICANHIITAEMEIKQMKKETKAYFWVANDFADETMVLEKLCVRFKTAEIAQDFYNAFEKARQECVLNKTLSPVVTKTQESKIDAKYTTSQTVAPKESNIQSMTTPQTKAVVGGFTFSSTPTFKSVTDAPEPESKSQDVATSKVNVFSGLNFKTNTSSPFTNLFNTTSFTVSNPSNNMQASETSTKLNNSDLVEEYEPNVDFKPVVPLPALVDQKTGEEDETILFEHRAKLLRFDVVGKEWKERGLGNIKLLVHKVNMYKVRLLMRREQIMKVCCNHAVTKDMVFQKMPNLDKAVTWCAKDFSEGELVPETFCLRFKTIQICDEFIEAIKSAQSKMMDVSKATKEEKNAAKQNNQSGFGDMFKPKAGSWHCDACYTNNLESFSKCACCEAPRPNSSATSSAPLAVPDTEKPIITVGWGDKFKPKPGSWECKDCFVRNESALENCSACNSPRDPTKAKPVAKLVSDNAPKFNFGMPPKTTSTAETALAVSQAAPFNVNVSAGTTNNTSMFGTPSSGLQFHFGIPPAANDQKSTEGNSTSIFDGTDAHKFSFGPPTNNLSLTSTTTSTQASGDQKPANSFLFGVPKTATENPSVLDFSVKKNEETSAPTKPALLPTPQSDIASNKSFGFKEGGTFDFVFKPKTPAKGKSPVKSPHKSECDGDESDGNEYAAEDECYHPFTPVIPLPDKVEVITGEENENELYGQLAKLYRFISGEWKERGKGIVKILKHKDTGKLRVVMRREQVLKICMNHALTPEITYNPKDEKSWLFAVNDFSEGELNLESFCLRFKSKEIAQEFKDAIDKALKGKDDVVTDKEAKSEKDGSDDVVFVGEIQATAEEKQKAKELMLPENFFTYKKKDPCQGCRGCTDTDESSVSETDSKSTVSESKVSTTSSEPKALAQTGEQKHSTVISTSSTSLVTALSTSAASTPAKITTPLFQSPTNSLYGTPSNLEKTVDTSIFRTPLGSNVKTATPSSQSIFGSATNKENTFMQTPSSIFSGLGDQTITFGTPQNKSTSIFGGSDSQTPTNARGSLLAPPKLSNLNTSKESQNESNVSFGSAQPKFVFSETKPITSGANAGISSNKSIFEFSSDKKAEKVNTEVKSVFGEDNKSENLFTKANQGSIFGPSALSNNQNKLGTSIFGTSGMSAFGSISSQNQVFGGGNSVFGNATNQAPTLNKVSTGEQPKLEALTKAAGDHKVEEAKTNKDQEKKEAPFSVENNLSFAALSSGTGPGFAVQKKPDFQWEGAGQQLFVAAQKNKDYGDKSKNDSGAGDESQGGAEEEYDPHYEPIVPLPDKIVVTTGEEDEEKLFGERCKLFRYDFKTREWKERGVGEMKVLYHPRRKTYRLLLRREQVHKAVLNMLLYTDLELRQMNNSDRAWTWAGRNFAENPAGEQETLAVRFKSADLATAFQDKVVECVRKLQAAAAQAIREEKEPDNSTDNVSPLRLPKHLQESARADNAFAAAVMQRTASTEHQPEAKTEASASDESQGTVTEVFKQVHFQESEEDHEDEEDYDYDYYNEEEEESAAYYTCEAEAIVRQGDNEMTCPRANIQVLFDQEIYTPKILVTDDTTKEILAEMVIHTDTEFQMNGDSCMWSGIDYTSNDPVDKTVIVNFYDSDSAMQFYDSCETSKAATYSSTDPVLD